MSAQMLTFKLQKYILRSCKLCNTIPVTLSLARSKPQSTHRLAMVDFRRTSHHDVKISPGWRGGGGGRPPPFNSPSCTNLQCTLQLRRQIHSPYFISFSSMYRNTDHGLLLVKRKLLCSHWLSLGNSRIHVIGRERRAQVRRIFSLFEQ